MPITTLTDNLAAAAGLMARDLVGDRMLTWVDDQERERLMTIYGATVTMPHDYEGEKYLINLLDTPGHVDTIICDNLGLTSRRQCEQLTEPWSCVVQ